MRHARIFLLVLPLLFGAAKQRTNEPVKPKITTAGGPAASQALLVYIGNVSGYLSLSIGIHVEIDSSIGIRYEVVMERGPAVITHTVLFYKFANPNQTIVHNYLTGKQSIEYRSGLPDKNPGLAVIGQETIDSFSCIHVEHGGGTDNVADYWMSKNIPGFSELASVVKQINPALNMSFLSSAIFNWGGLVRMRVVHTDPRTGQSSMDLRLQEANEDVSFPASDFDPPAK